MNLKVENLNKSYNDKPVLYDLNFSLRDVQVLGVIGPSGGGKTTLLRILAGLEKPDGGIVTVNGTVIPSEEKALAEYRKTIGMVFQSYNLFPHLTAFQNIALPLEKVRNYSKKEARALTEKLLERFSLIEHGDKLPVMLSGGQQQRVAIIRALSINPQLLLLDEPTSALDPALTGSVLSLIGMLKADKKDLILVTHEMKFARQACDYCLFIAEGTVMEMGTSEAFFGNPRNHELIDFLTGF
jgi:ABC-type polar amino acid transport system, ATPase component